MYTRAAGLELQDDLARGMAVEERSEGEKFRCGRIGVFEEGVQGSSFVGARGFQA
jgi:hypothetical protein